MKKGVIVLILLLVCIPVVYSETISFSDLFRKGLSYIDIPGKGVFEGENIPPQEEINVPDSEVFDDSPSTVTYFYAKNNLVASKVGGEVVYNYNNRLGSDTTGKQLPFGQEIYSENRFSFTGKELDGELYYFGARYYDSNIGRFTSVDPVKSNHAYSYVANNPMNYVDPWGMGEYTPWLSLPNSAPAGVIPYSDYPIAEIDTLSHPAYPDTLISGGTITLGSPGNRAIFYWSSPDSGSPVDYYSMQLSFCIDCEIPGGVRTLVRVAGTDGRGRQGVWSGASSPWDIFLPPPEEGMMWEPDDTTGALGQVPIDTGNEGDPPGDDPDDIILGSRGGFMNQNYPNPVRSSTTFTYSIPEGSWSASDINIYNAMGALVHTLPTNKAIGEHSAKFDINSVSNGGLASGVYFALMTVNEMPSPLKFDVVK